MAQLEQWPERFKGEPLWRTVRTLGIVHWLSSVDQFRRRANAWADSGRPRDWQCAASYLAGVYETAPHMQEQQGDDPAKAVVWLLDQWVQRAHTTANVSVGCAAARTYGLLGRRDPAAALRGLNKLLYLTGDILQQTQRLPDEVFNEGITHYVSLIWSGHIRLLLQQLADHADRLVYPNASSARSTPLVRQREPLAQNVGLRALLETSVLVCAASLSSAKNGQSASYSFTHSLPE